MAAGSASANTTAGALPPSSRCSRFVVGAAADITARPAREEPVMDTIATPGCSTRAAPTSAPPVTTLSTPGGRPASTAISASRRVDEGVSGAGLSTTVLPAASAGPSFQIAITNGKFHGAIPATTPTGRRTIIEV